MRENSASSFGQVDDNLLHGMIPGDNLRLYFTEETVAGKGDCGFIALGHDRKEVADVLSRLSSDEGVRTELWQEIYEAYQTNALKQTPEFEALYNSYQEPNILESVREDRRKVIEAYCKREDVFKAYVEAYRNKLWLGYKSALLFGRVIGMTVYVWKKDSNRNITVYDSTVAQEQKGQVVHMLLTQGYSHYNLLVETKAPIQENNKEGDVQKVMFLDPRDEGHQNFAKKIATFEAAQLRQMFVKPDSGYKKIIETLDDASKRAHKEAQQTSVRHNSAQYNFELISGLALSLPMFKNVKLPILRSELKKIVLVALEMLYEETKSDGILLKIIAVDPKHKLVNIKKPKPKQVNSTQSFDEEIKQLVKDIKANQPLSGKKPQVNTPQQKVDSAEKSKASKVIPQKSSKGILRESKTDENKKKTTDKSSSSVKKVSFATSATSSSSGKSLNANQDQLGFIDKAEKPILNAVKNFGYTKFVKTPEVYSLLNDKNGHKINFHKNGGINSDNYYLTESTEKLAQDLTDVAIVIANTQLELSKKFGDDLAFPNGPVILRINSSGNLSKDEEEKANKVRSLVQDLFNRKMQAPVYDSIRGKVLLQTNLPPRVVSKEDQGLTIKPTATTFENVQQQSHAPSVSDFRKHVSPVYEARVLSEKSNGAVEKANGDQKLVTEKKIQKTKEQESSPPLAYVAPIPDGKPGGVNNGKGDDLRKQVLREAHSRRTFR